MPEPWEGHEGSANLIRQGLPDRSFFKNYELPVLMYHQVVEHLPAANSYNLHVTLDQLEEQFRFLQKNGFSTIGFEDILLRKIPSKPVVITFDDGYEDNYKFLFPLLKKYDFKAVIYILGNRNQRYNSWDKVDRETRKPLLRGRQILEMSKSGHVEFGSHSMDHLDLTTLTSNALEKEIAGSKKALEKFLGLNVLSFCYPYGRTNERVKGMVQKAGFSFGIGGDGPARFGKDLMSVRREPIFPSTTLFRYWKKTSGFYYRYQDLKNRFRSTRLRSKTHDLLDS